MAERSRIVVADDHGVVRMGLVALLERQPDMVVVGEAAGGNAALEQVAALAPDVLVLDVRMPDRDGISVCREVRQHYPGTHVVILTSFADETALVDALVAGARGYVLKSLDNDALVAAIRTVIKGGVALDPDLGPSVLAGMQALAGGVRDQGMRGQGGREAEGLARSDPRVLSQQERRILAEIARGLTNREIGERLRLSEKTVRNYVSQILAKLGLRNRAEAATYAVQHGILER